VEQKQKSGTECQLKDLAGNGFATTIVAAIVVAVFSS
jgi:hypothetical protein